MPYPELEIFGPNPIAIVGMAGRFPGADSVAEFWENLRAGRESIMALSEEDLQSSGIAPALLRDPRYIRAAATIGDIEMFDANFFGMSAHEANLTDPQQRIFLEVASQALEDAAISPEQFKGWIGVYAAAAKNGYLVHQLLADGPNHAPGDPQVVYGNEKDYIATRLSYKLNLRGPSLSVQTACSSSLVAVSLACQSLLTYQCDLAVVGGANVQVPQKAGYLFEEGAYSSPDGHCRAFDADAQGTVFSNGGVGVVILRRLEDAWADGDNIRAVIRGSAVNNDGADKVGFTAPSVDGQAAVIALAQKVAGISSDTVDCIEGHGTGTPLGDPIEVAALTRAFRKGTRRTGFCALGSVKTNIGHAGAAAGVAGLIKTVMALEHQELPPSLHFTKPNPQIEFSGSPFYVNDRLRDWPRGNQPRRAGVSSFGIGGTNAHVVLEEAPVRGPSAPYTRSRRLFVLSAKTCSALESMARRLARHLREHPEQELADVAYTLQVGRRRLPYRRFIVCENRMEALDALEHAQDGFPSVARTGLDRPLVFLFPGGGAQYVGMGADLYAEEPVFRDQMDECARILNSRLGLDLRKKIYPGPEETESASGQMRQSRFGLPALFAVSYSLARLWMSWGVEPRAMMGHSLGEYVAACLAGVFSLEDALTLVALRGELFESLPAGAMVAVSLTADEMAARLAPELSIAAVNSPKTCVVSGAAQDIERLATQLTQEGVEIRHIPLATAAHSKLVEPALAEFERAVSRIQRNAPRIPFISNVTGDWITAEQCQSSRYWADHLRQTVRFDQGLRKLLTNHGVFLESGPGHTLSSLVRQAATPDNQPAVFGSLRHPHESQHDGAFIAASLGGLWMEGGSVDWNQYHRLQPRRRQVLPAYPFERERYWYDPPAFIRNAEPAANGRAEVADFFYVPYWKPAPPQMAGVKAGSGDWLAFADTVLAPRFVADLREQGRRVILAEPASQFAVLNTDRFAIDPDSQEDYRTLIAAIRKTGKLPSAIAYFWSIGERKDESGELEDRLKQSFYGLIFLAQALANEEVNQKLKLLVVSWDVCPVLGNETLSPAGAAVLGPVRVIPQEHVNISCLHVDLASAELLDSPDRLSLQLRDAFDFQGAERSIALRNGRKWLQAFEPLRIPEDRAAVSRLRPEGVYLITGGLGKIGLALARRLAGTVRARLVLVSRSGIQDPEMREAWAAAGKSIRAHRSEVSFGADVSFAPGNPRNAAREKEVLEDLERLGAKVLVAQADVGNIEDMRSILDQVRERFGGINGVVHAAMIPGGGMIQLRAASVAKSEFRPKIQGAMVLQELFRDRPLDFLVVCSSLVALRGYLGLTGYCAACSVLDAFAHRHAAENPDRLVVSIDWGLWDMRGMAIPFNQKQEALAVRDPRLGIREEEGAEAFSRVLACRSLPQVIISPYAPSATEAVREEEASVDALTQPPSRESEGKGRLHSRPDLQQVYVAPRNEVETKLADIWQSVLGVGPIGIDDRFTELGGDSLMGVRVISKAREACQMVLTVRMLFRQGTIRHLVESAGSESGAADRVPEAVSVSSVSGDGLEEGEI